MERGGVGWLLGPLGKVEGSGAGESFEAIGLWLDNATGMWVVWNHPFGEGWDLMVEVVVGVSCHMGQVSVDGELGWVAVEQGCYVSWLELDE
ncbi:hypothetical protein Tco_0204260 [Tanacetum coccineum]